MRFRTHKFSTTMLFAVALAVFMLIIFALTNAGLDPRAGHFRDFDPEDAAPVCFGLLGLYHSIAIIFFDEDDSTPSKAKAAADSHIPRAPDSYTGFIRQPWYKVLSVGPVFAAFSAASVFLWHTFAEFPGTPGTMWGDYASSALPAFALFLTCWSAANIGFMFAAIAEAFNRDHPGITITSLIVMFIVGIGLTIGFIFMANGPTDRILTLAALVFPLSLCASVGTHVWARVRVARYDAAHPHQSPRARRRATKFGAHKVNQGGPGRGGPPVDLLEPGERLLMHFRSDRTPEPQLLIATDQRFVRASILGSDRTFILEQASPGQLSGGTSERVGHDLMTTAHFRDRQAMRVVGGDPEQSRAFAEAITFLARTGKVRR